MDQLPIAIRLLLAGLIAGPASVFVGATGGRNSSFAASSPAGELAAPSHKTMSQTTWYQNRGPASGSGRHDGRSPRILRRAAGNSPPIEGSFFYYIYQPTAPAREFSDQGRFHVAANSSGTRSLRNCTRQFEPPRSFPGDWFPQVPSGVDKTLCHYRLFRTIGA